MIETKHVLILFGWLGSVAVMIGGLPNWHAALTPQFIGGLLGAASLHVLGVYTEKPKS